MTFSCPSCNKQLTVDDSLAGKKGRCPYCQSVLEIPSPTDSGSAAAAGDAAGAGSAPVGSAPAPGGEAVQWYYAVAGQRQGPVSTQQLVQFCQTGAVRSDTPVWRQGMSDWQPMGSVAELSGQVPRTGTAYASPQPASGPVGGYGAPPSYGARPGYGPSRYGANRLRGFPKGWIITDLVFCSIRAILVIVGLYGLSHIPKSNPLYEAGIFEVLTGLGMAVFGLIANVMLLSGKKAGVGLGWVNVVCTFGSIIVGVWQASIQSDHVPSGSPQAAGFMVGIVLALVVRVALNVLYIVALNGASKQLSR